MIQAFAQDQTQTTGLTQVEAAIVVAYVSPHSYWTPRGSVLAGGIWDLFYSDNLPMVIRSDYGGGMAVQLMVEGRLPVDASGLAIGVESQATSPNIQQTISLWDWNSRTWVHMGSDVIGSWDSLAEFSVIGDPLRFSQAGTGRMRAAIGYQAVGSTWTPLWQSRVDSVFWTYSR